MVANQSKCNFATTFFLSTFAICAPTEQKIHNHNETICWRTLQGSKLNVHALKINALARARAIELKARMKGERWNKKEDGKQIIGIYSMRFFCWMLTLSTRMRDALLLRQRERKSNFIDDATISWECRSMAHSIASQRKLIQRIGSNRNHVRLPA